MPPPSQARKEKRRADPSEVINRAESSGYVKGAHKEQDEVPISNCGSHFQERQDHVLHIYVCWKLSFLPEGSDYEHCKSAELRSGAPLPLIHELKDFWRFYHGQSKGKLKAHTSRKSLLARAKEFKSGFGRLTGTWLSDEDTEEINKFIPTITDDVEYTKFNYQRQDLDRHLTKLWQTEEIDMTEIERFEFHFLLLLYCQSGARVSALLKGLPFKDVSLVLLRDKYGNPDLYFRLDQRHVKNNKDPENKKFGVVGRNHPQLRLNAVWLLLNIAIHYGALNVPNITEIINGNGHGTIPWKPAFLDVAICTMSKQRFLFLFRALFESEYIGVRASIHMIRRGIGKYIDEAYTAAQRSQHLLQKDTRIFGQSYVAFVSSCDGLGAFLQEPLNHKGVDYFQGLSQFWQPGLPTRLPPSRKAQLRAHPDMIKHAQSITKETNEATKSRVSQDRDNTLLKLQKQALARYRQERFEELQNKTLLEGHTHRADPPLVFQLIPEKAALAQAMAASETAIIQSAEHLMKCAQSLLSMPEVFYPKGEEPRKNEKREECPHCGRGMDEIEKHRRCQHILQCRRKDLATKWNMLPSQLEFCYQCRKFYKHSERNAHFDNEHPKLSLMHCGAIRYRSTLVQPAFCLICVESKKLHAHRYWGTDTDAIAHIAEEHGWSWYCRECDFQSESRADGIDHLWENHGYRPQATRSRLPKSKSIDDTDDFKPDDATMPKISPMALGTTRKPLPNGRMPLPTGREPLPVDKGLPVSSHEGIAKSSMVHGPSGTALDSPSPVTAPKKISQDRVDESMTSSPHSIHDLPTTSFDLSDFMDEPEKTGPIGPILEKMDESLASSLKAGDVCLPTLGQSIESKTENDPFVWDPMGDREAMGDRKHLPMISKLEPEEDGPFLCDLASEPVENDPFLCDYESVDDSCPFPSTPDSEPEENFFLWNSVPASMDDFLEAADDLSLSCEDVFRAFQPAHDAKTEVVQTGHLVDDAQDAGLSPTVTTKNQGDFIAPVLPCQENVETGDNSRRNDSLLAADSMPASSKPKPLEECGTPRNTAKNSQKKRITLVQRDRVKPVADEVTPFQKTRIVLKRKNIGGETNGESDYSRKRTRIILHTKPKSLVQFGA